MLSKNKIKFIHSLSIKKFRNETGLFIAEGEKIVQELIRAGFKVETIISSGSNLNIKYPNCEIIPTSIDEIKKISSLKTPPSVIAICKIPIRKEALELEKNNVTLVLDELQDPGNLGTIIRLASWFGIKDIICSPKCADSFSPKVVQATMGAIAHVSVTYLDLNEFLNGNKTAEHTIYGTYLEGENIYKADLKNNAIVILGNEGKGISPEYDRYIHKKILIPTFAEKGKNVESLNVSMAASVVCSEFKRRMNFY
jgi:RNA methyltransferase, TrmH family